MFNTNESIRSFAKACFSYALDRHMPLMLSTKNTILKKYDGLFMDIFSDEYERNFRGQFESSDLYYEHHLIDDLVAQAIKSHCGFV